ncbi:LuxR C-terminal-related transcriptional regulator [Euzebya rosea]|uniref:LuxR C-terminal-related transcriptional regulator n=1 Tax=Euzebya rosea TaxID=2052804 RepID=UPI0013009754|nr:LuxR C-terminal-related transcriptional regulator [Euzebya rosea]
MAVSPAGRNGRGPRTWPGKLRPPPLPDGHVARPALVSAIEDGLARSGVVLLSAGDGFGKSTLLSEYARHPRPSATAWLSLDSHDDDPQVFLTAALEALAMVHPDLFTEALVAAGNATDAAQSLAFRMGVCDLEHLDDPVTLVIDDLDQLRHPSIVSGLRRLLRYRPPHLRLVLATRDDLLLDPDRLQRGSGALVLGEDELVLTEAETARIAASRHGALDDDRVHELHVATGGWAAGVVLASPRDPHGPVFDIRAQPVARFLREAIVDGLPDHLSTFLLELCMLPHVSVAMATTATGREDCARLLQDLQVRRLLEPRTDLHGATWVVPPIIRDFGRHELRTTDPDRATEVVLNAAWAMVRKGDFEEGAVLAMQSGDDYEAARLLLRVHLGMSTSGHGLRVHELASTLQSRLPHLPELSLASAWGAVQAGLDDLATEAMRTAAATTIRGQRGRFIRAEVQGLRAHLLRRKGEYAESVRAVREGLALLRDTEVDAEWSYADSIRTRAPLDMGMASFLAGDLDTAITAFEMVTGGDVPGPMRAVAHSYLALIAWLEGQHDPATHAAMAKLLEQRTTQAPDLAHFITSVTVALSEDGVAGRDGLVDAELISACMPEPGAQAMVRLARARRLATGAPVGDAVADAYGAGVRTDDPSALVADVRRILDEIPDPGVLPRIVERVRGELGEGPTLEGYGEELTDGERKVIRLLDTALTEREIAMELHLSHNTVRTYRRRLYRKLGVTSRRAAVEAWKALQPGALDQT